MSNLKKTSYVFIALAIALLLAAISISVAFNINEAYADYNDVLTNPDSIVNFNQYVQNGNFTSVSSWGTENGVSYTVNNGFGSVTSSNNSSGIYQNNTTSIIYGHKFYAMYSLASNTNDSLIINVCGNTESVTINSN